MNNFFNQNTSSNTFPFNDFNTTAPNNFSNVNMGTANSSSNRYNSSRGRSHNYSSNYQANSQPYPVNFGNNTNFINYNSIFNLNNVYQSNNNEVNELNDNISLNLNQNYIRMRKEILAKMLRCNYECYLQKLSKKDLIHEYFDLLIKVMFYLSGKI